MGAVSASGTEPSAGGPLPAAVRGMCSIDPWTSLKVALFPKPEGTKAPTTRRSAFGVDNIADAIAQLKSRGVAFADYASRSQDGGTRVCAGSEKAAWFEDTEGNILCLHEDLV